jgi:hypothetical protein
MGLSGLRRVLLPLTAAAMLLPASCARTPAGLANNGGPQLIVTMTVAGHINPQYFYFVLFDVEPAGTNDPGPLPVISTPWNNGFATGSFTSYVEWNADAYSVWSAPNTGTMPPQQPYTYLGVPVASTTVQDNISSTISFQIPLSELATASVPASEITSVTVNFINTNQLPADTEGGNTGKLFDALGDDLVQPGGINQPVKISTVQSATYDNNDLTAPAQEVVGDVVECENGSLVSDDDPDLDITAATGSNAGWSVQVVR